MHWKLTRWQLTYYIVYSAFFLIVAVTFFWASRITKLGRSAKKDKNLWFAVAAAIYQKEINTLDVIKSEIIILRSLPAFCISPFNIILMWKNAKMMLLLLLSLLWVLCYSLFCFQKWQRMCESSYHFVAK